FTSWARNRTTKSWWPNSENCRSERPRTPEKDQAGLLTRPFVLFAQLALALFLRHSLQNGLGFSGVRAIGVKLKVLVQGFHRPWSRSAPRLADLVEGRALQEPCLGAGGIGSNRFVAAGDGVIPFTGIE